MAGSKRRNTAKPLTALAEPMLGGAYLATLAVERGQRPKRFEVRTPLHGSPPQRHGLIVAPDGLEDCRAFGFHFGAGRAQALGGVEIGQRLLESMHPGARSRARKEREAIGGGLTGQSLRHRRGPLAVGDAAKNLSAEGEAIDQVGRPAAREPCLRGLQFEALDLRVQVDQRYGAVRRTEPRRHHSGMPTRAGRGGGFGFGGCRYGKVRDAGAVV